MVKDKLERLVEKIDPRLTFKEVIGEGGYSVVSLVEHKKRPHALKINRFHEASHLDASFTIENEYDVMKGLKGVYGIPEVYKFYRSAPSLTEPGRRGKNAFLMRYIEGTTLLRSGMQNGFFFMKVRGIVDEIHRKGYCIPISDFSAENIIVDEENEPWLIDFMRAIKLDGDKEIAEQQKRLSLRRLRWLRERYEN